LVTGFLGMYFCNARRRIGYLKRRYGNKITVMPGGDHPMGILKLLMEYE